jgi:hypothetical protein
MKTITLGCFLFLAGSFANAVTAQFVGGAGNTTVLFNNPDLVGAGTLAPTYKLEVIRSDGNSKIAMFRNSYTGDNLDRTSLIDIQNGSGIRWRCAVGGTGNGLGLNAGQFYIERPGGNVVLTMLQNNGNVGIGVKAPVTKLQVAGHITPSVNCIWDLGSPNLQWHNLYLCGIVMRVQKEVSNIQDLTYGLKDILKLRAVTYTDDQKKIGLIAQEAQKVIPEMVSTSTISIDETSGKITEEKNKHLGLDYDVMIPVFINAFKEQQAAIEAKDKQLNDLQAQVEEFQTQLNELKSMLVTQGLQQGNKIGNENLSKAILQSVAPNPFNTTTTIRYFIPDNAGSVAINIVGANGGVMKTYSGLQKGTGQLVINGSELAAGTYMAVLVVNGVKVSSKQMVLTK